MEAGAASTLVHIGKSAFLGISIDGSGGGLTIANIIPGTAAAVAGLAVGDDITSIDGTPVSALDDVRTILFRHHPGDAVTVGYTDTVGNQTQTTLTLGDGPPQ